MYARFLLAVLALPGVAWAAVADPALPTRTTLAPGLVPALVADPAAGRSVAHTLNAYRLNLPRGATVVAVGNGFATPVVLKLGDGRCLLVENGRRSEAADPGGVRATDCAGLATYPPPRTPEPPRAGLRLIGTAFGFAAWWDEAARITLIFDLFLTPQRLLYSTAQKVLGIGAIRCPDCNGADMSIVSEQGGSTIITLNELSW